MKECGRGKKNKCQGRHSKNCVEEIKKIPAGQTRTYKEIAVSIGNPEHRELLPMLAQPTQIQSKYHATE